MKLIHHADGSYSLTGLRAEDVRDMAWAFSSHETVQHALRLREALRFDQVWSSDHDSTDDGTERHAALVRQRLENAVGYSASAINLRRRQSVEIPSRDHGY